MSLRSKSHITFRGLVAQSKPIKAMKKMRSTQRNVEVSLQRDVTVAELACSPEAAGESPSCISSSSSLTESCYCHPYHLMPRVGAGVYNSAATPFFGMLRGCWIEKDLSWCHACGEPVELKQRGLHSALNREHVNHNTFFFVWICYPRCWSVRETIIEAQRNYQKLWAMHCCGNAALTLQDDVVRRDELAAVIAWLATGTKPVLYYSLRGVFPTSALTGQGEKMFRCDISNVVMRMLPLMSNNCQASLQQKSWGRSNLEKLYDTLDIAKLQLQLGGKPGHDRSDKSIVMRQLICELYFSRIAKEATEDGSEKTPSLIEEIRAELSQWALDRMAFELVYLCTFSYMTSAQNLVGEMNYPDPTELQELGFE